MIANLQTTFQLINNSFISIDHSGWFEIKWYAVKKDKVLFVDGPKEENRKSYIDPAQKMIPTE